jgi:hypothetical protein
VDRLVNFVTDEIPTGSPQILSISPPTGSPAGGYVVTILGRSIFAPVRVFFGSQEAVVSSFTEETVSQPAEIKVVVPRVELGVSAQFQEVSVTVVSRAGTTNEASGSTGAPDNNPATDDAFRYELEIMTPFPQAVAPPSGPNEGNTRISIFGEGFQSPLAAYFGSGNTRVDLEVVSVSFSQIIAITPPASGLGSEFANNSVSLTVHNIASNKTGTLSSAFRYGPEMQIISVSPSSGTALGGTRVTIHGFGFDDPVAVTLAGVPAQVIRVSGTEIIAIASAPRIANCSMEGGGSGPVIVTNIEDGQSVDGPDFTYILDTPVITFVSPLPATEGAGISVTVLNPGTGSATFKIGDRTVFPTPAGATSPLGTTTFTMTVPTGLEFDTEDCTTAGGAAGTVNAPTNFDLVFRNVITGCDAELEGGITINPSDTTCNAGPVGTVAPSTIVFPDTTVGVTSAPIPFTIGNIGSADLVILGITSSDPQFAVGLPSQNPVPPSGSATVNVTFTPTAAAAATGTITILTNDPNNPELVVDVSGTGTP